MRERHAVAAGVFGSLTGFATKLLFRNFTESLPTNIVVNAAALLLFVVLTVLQTKSFMLALSEQPVGYSTAISFFSNIAFSVGSKVSVGVGL